MGFLRSRNAYSTTTCCFERHNSKPMVGRSSGFLPADECKATSELEHETLDVVYEGLLNLAFSIEIRAAQEIEKIGILENFGGSATLYDWKR